MKTRYIVLAFAALLMAACAKEAAQHNYGQSQVVITAWQEGAPEVKSTLVDGGSQVYWEPGDAIKVFYDKVGNKFETQITSPATICDFKGSLGFVGGGTESAAPEKYIWGLYPFRAGATSDGNSVTTSLSGNQTGKAGSFASNTNITLARSESFGLAFYNVCGGIRFSLTKPGIKRVVLESLGGEAIAGTFTATFDKQGVPAITDISDPITKITLKAPDDEFQTGVWYYIVALSQTLTKGFKLTFRSETGTGTITYDKQISIKRGIFGSLENVDANVEFSAGGGDDPEDIEIEIDGEFWDWASVAGQTSGNHTVKVASDNKNVYVYSRRVSGGRYSEIWGADSYIYFGFDLDNNSSTGESLWGSAPFEFVGFIRPYGGTADSPVIIEAAGASNCTSLPSTSTVKNIICLGITDESGYTMEFSIPRADIPAIPNTPISIKFWGNKGLDTVILTCTL